MSDSDDSNEIDVEATDSETPSKDDLRDPQTHTPFVPTVREIIEETTAFLEGSHAESKDGTEPVAYATVLLIADEEGRIQPFSARYIDPELRTQTTVNTIDVLNEELIDQALPIGLQDAVDSNSPPLTMGTVPDLSQLLGGR